MKKDIVLLIPALDPPESFPEYVKTLREAGYENIIVVDDGTENKRVFNEIEGAIILTHEENRGKGSALKTGFTYYLENYNQKECKGVITLDCDGQHILEDVEKLCHVMQKDDKSLILGSRDFTLPNIPPKSKFGNRLTLRIFKLFFRLNLSDTQTGLRGIPNSLLPACLRISGNRFEYETKMLIAFGKTPGIVEVPITTVYLEENQGTHFNPVKDSVRIYYAIFGSFFRFLFSSLSSFVVDILLFALFAKLIFSGLDDRVFIATICARIISAVFNYTINHKVVFKSEEHYVKTALKYMVLCVCQMLASAGIVYGITRLTGFEEVIIKIITDTCLFLISFYIQKKVIFKESVR